MTSNNTDIFVPGHGGNEWLAQTVEPALEPGLPICDPHHHLWHDSPERQPFPTYMLDDLAADASSGHNVRSTVYVQTGGAGYLEDGPKELRSVGEVKFVEGQAEASASGRYGDFRAAAGIVGHVDLTLGERVAPVLDALQAASPGRFRGIRHSVTSDPHPAAAGSTNREPGLLADERFCTGARALAAAGHSFEAWLYHPQLNELVEFANAVPDLTIVLNHVGGLTRVGPYAERPQEVLDSWRAGIAAAAACPNIVVKLGGLGMPRVGFDYHTRVVPVGSEELAKDLAPFLQYCIEQFGPERSMFESNFPVDKVSYSHHILFNAFKRLSAGYSPSERTAMFHDTATRVYRITDTG
jgi:L-fuconolactonase